MAPTSTPRKLTTLTLAQKAKIIEDSKKPGFSRAATMEKYGIGKATYLQATSNDPALFDALKLLENHCLQSSSQERQLQPQITDIFKSK